MLFCKDLAINKLSDLRGNILVQKESFWNKTTTFKLFSVAGQGDQSAPINKHIKGKVKPSVDFDAYEPFC